MGLDIAYYSRIIPAKCIEDDYTQIRIHEDEAFPKHKNPLSIGCYVQCEGAVSGHFAAGSYGGYGVWRDSLARMIKVPKVGTNLAWPHASTVWDDPTTYSRFPFVELIHFSDCRGAIGSVFAKKLVKNFRDYDKIAREFESGITEAPMFFYQKYQLWRAAFEAAADDGVVIFA